MECVICYESLLSGRTLVCHCGKLKRLVYLIYIHIVLQDMHFTLIVSKHG